MILFVPVLSVLVVNALPAKGFHISFNTEPLCNGTATGELDLGKDGVCHTDFFEGSTGYRVNTTDDADNGNLVVFYQFSGCEAETEIAASNVPVCVAGGFGSFKVLGVEDCCLDNADFQDAGFEGVASDIVVQPSTTIAISSLASTFGTQVPSLAARDHSTREQPSTNEGRPHVYHGAIRFHGNKRYKMQQVAHGMFRGVDLDDWDDSIHLKDDTKLDLPDIEIPDISSSNAVSHPKTSNMLEARLFKYATCSAALQCAYDVATVTMVGVVDVIEYFLAAAKAAIARLPTAVGFWEFLNKPFVVGVLSTGVLSMGPSAFGGWVGGQTQKSDPPNSPTASRVTTSVAICSDSEDEADVMKTVVGLTLAGKPTTHVTDMTASVLLPNGQTGIFSVNTRTDGDETPEVCGAPTKAS